ncbi:MAG: Spy/CpxP family protein refolding chaperone [Cyanobacteria bacterium J06641_5]
MMAFPNRLAISFLGAAVLSGWTALAGPIRAQNFEFGPLLEELRLSNEQRQQLRAIKSEYSTELSRIKRQLREERAKLIRMLVGTASESGIRAQHEQVKALSDRLAELSFEGMLEARTVLTPDQRDRAVQHLNNRKHQAASSEAP